jgi:hypothetical protein
MSMPGPSASFPVVRPARSVSPPLTVTFGEIGRADVELVGGKGANLGEMVRSGLPVPPATTRRHWRRRRPTCAVSSVAS